MASKWNKWFTDKKDQIKTAVRFEKKFPFYFLSITLIIIISVLIRLTPVINDVYLIKAFDPWIQYHSTEYIIENGWYEFFNWIDYKSWYPTGIDRGRLRPGLLGSAALFYRVISALGIPITPYEACFYFPAFMGGLTVLVMYFLGKEVLDKKTGLIAAFFLAVNPGHMQRTVIGFFDNETVGVFGVLMVLLFFVKSVKSGKRIHGVIAGCSLGYLSLSWGGLSFRFLLIPLLSLFLILLNRYDGKLLVSYALTEGLGIFIYVLNKQWSYEKMFNSIEVIVPLGWLAFLIFYHMFYIRKGTGLYEKMIKTVKWGSIPVAIVFAIIFWYYPDVLPFNLGSRIYSIINPNIRESMHIVASVGEHMPSPWSVFYSNSLICLLLVIPG